jgi:RNA polymerase sigma factor (sigma-70 family)
MTNAEFEAELRKLLNAGATRDAVALIERVRGSWIRTTLRAKLQSENTVKDVHGEICVSLLKSLDKYRFDCSPDGYLGTVVRNAVKRAWQRRRRGRAHGTLPSHIPHAPLTRPAWDNTRARNVLDALVRELPEIDRRILSLVRAGHSFAEIAVMLSMPSAESVRSRCRRAQNVMRGKVQREGT